MGSCVAKGPVKVVPISNDTNTVSAKHSRNSEINFCHRHPELTDNSQDTSRVSGAKKGEKRDNSTAEKRCGEEPNFNKEENSQVDINQATNTRAVGRNKIVELKEQGELPKLVKTSGYSYKGDGTLQKSVAFDVNFNESMPNNHPRKLKKLEGAPHLTAELLKQKQEIAEQNRTKELQKKAETSSKHRRDIFQAHEYEKFQTAKMQMHSKLLASERNRQSQLEGIIDKQKRREQKAKEVRAKGCGLEDTLVHVDETYNSDSSEDPVWEDDKEKQSRESCAESNEDISSIDEFFERGPQEQSSNIFE